MERGGKSLCMFFNFKIESIAINNTITRVPMCVAVGQIWIQAALLESKQGREESIRRNKAKKNNANNKQQASD